MDIGKSLKEESEKPDASGPSSDDFEKELATNTSAFEALERDFQEVLQELMGDQSLERFRLEYEKLHRALKKSHEQEKRLVKKCRELNSEILNNQAKIKTALRLSQEDQKTISHLQKEMEKTWKLVYAAQEKETRGKETIQALKEEMANLSKLVERGAGLSINQENMVKELRQAKEELERQLEEQGAQTKMMEVQLKEQFELRDRLTSKENENNRETKRREKTQKELMDVRNKLDAAEVKELEVLKELNDAKATMDKYLRDYEALSNRTQKITDDLDAQNQKNKKLVESVQKGEKELELKKRNGLKYQQLLEESKIPLQLANQEVENLKKELIAARRQELNLNKTVDKEKGLKDAQIKATAKAEMGTKEVKGQLIEEQRAGEQTTKELDDKSKELIRMRKAMFSMEKDRERLGLEVTEHRNSFLKSEEELKLREVQIGDLVKRVQEWETKLKSQQQLYENVRADRNHYSKALVESEDEVAELRKKFKIMGHQIDQLKEEITSKDQALVKEHFEFQKSEKLRENVQAELNRKNQLISTNHDLVHQQDAEMKRLTSAIRHLDAEALAQRKEYDQVINERDILGTQLIRRNDELALLYEKLRVQQSALKTGESQYSARIDDIRMKREILQLQKELLQEKTKVTALSEELENPMNVHRWRKLEGSDPATFELIQKIQTLQKRLISKTEEVVEKGLIIQEKEKMYQELKNILARQPGPEMSEQIGVYQQNLKQKTRQLKAMASELNMFQAQVNEYKYEVERLNRELQEMKRKYYQQKRKDQMMRDQEMEGVGGQAQARGSQKRFTGGGFAIK
eukprot:GSChrysophyteH1.ASY1.ANO1.2649.1 assembled CDS